MPTFLETVRERDRQHRKALAEWEALGQYLPGPIDPSVTSGLTICSVAFKGKACLEQNDRVLRALNPEGEEPRAWLLFDNNEQASERIDPGDSRFRVVRPNRRDVDMGYEHALGLAALFPHIRTRFVLFLDPDCFIVLPNWVRSVIDHMKRHELGFFGTPINPRRHNSYRYFPYVVCMFVDLARVPLRDLCFVPDVWEWKTSLTYRARKALAGIPKLGILFRWLLTERWLTNGWRIKAKYGDGRLARHECVQGVWDINETIPPGTLRRVIHNLTPGSVSPIPKKAGYCSSIGFAALGAPDVSAKGWEEFVWQGRPFAFHLGSAHSKAIDRAALDGIIDRFVACGRAVAPEVPSQVSA